MFKDGTPDDPLSAYHHDYPVLYWNWVGMELNRVSTGLQGPQGGPTLSSRALGLLHLAMHDAWFGARGIPGRPLYAAKAMPASPSHPRKLSAAATAMSAAAITVLGSLYRGQSRTISRVSHEQIVGTLDQLIRTAPFDIDTLSSAYRYGEEVACLILDLLMIHPGQPGADQGAYQPQQGRYRFRDEPTHPVRLQPIDPDHPKRGNRAARIYHAPFYGETAATFAVKDADKLQLKAPPTDADPIYVAALAEVIRLGGAADLASTERTPAQTVAGIYWAYDGANLIGTPPRLYNQILRTTAWNCRNTTKTGDDASDDFVRLFALCNAAMADAGKFAWREKYRFEFWRPLSGVREHDITPSVWDDEAGAIGLKTGADPLWRTLGAPDTNSNRLAFKPPFPAYPSGHATFGAACFQMIRRFYAFGTKPDKSRSDHQNQDTIGFTFMSDELNGVSRQLYQEHDPARPITDQPGDVRTAMKRCFPSLNHAIFENAFSRIFLGVHWRFDAFGGTTPVIDGAVLADPAALVHDGLGPDGHGEEGKMTGGIPLGLAIANQIFDDGLVHPDPACRGIDPPAAIPMSKISNTNLR